MNETKSAHRQRVFVFRQVEEDKATRPRLLAIPEDKIQTIESRLGSHNCYLVINGVEVKGSFDDFVKWFGVRVDIE